MKTDVSREISREISREAAGFFDCHQKPCFKMCLTFVFRCSRGLDNVDEERKEAVRPVLDQVWSLAQLTITDQCKKVRFQQMHNQGLHMLFLTVSWDFCA